MPSGKLHIHRFGSGPVTIIALHGYGETGAHFQPLAEALGPGFSLVCPDLPLHGQTHWNGQQWSIPEFMDEWGSEHLFALGYSMGARLWLAAFQRYPERFQKLVLVAPDGLTINPWYWFATQTALGNRVFENTMKHPGWFFRATKTARKARLLNESVYKFTRTYLENQEQRDHLYHRWTFYRHFYTQSRKTAALVKNHKLPVELIMGEHDRIIPPALGRQWAAACGPSCHVHVLDAGHRLLQGAAAKAVASTILQGDR